MKTIFLPFQATRISIRNRKNRGSKRPGLAVIRALTTLPAPKDDSQPSIS